MDKIVFIIPNMTGGGTERVISLLSTEYIKRGFQVAIMQFAGYQHAYELDSRVEDFSISEQSGGNPLVQIRRIRDMRRYFKKNPDCHIFAFCVNGAVFSAVATLGMRRPFRERHSQLGLSAGGRDYLSDGGRYRLLSKRHCPEGCDYTQSHRHGDSTAL